MANRWGSWTWTDAAIFIVVISALQLAMFWLLTKVFLGMITEGDRCPVCDAETSAVERRGWWHVVSFGIRNRRSWCISCGWEGVLRRSDAWVARERERRRAWRQARSRSASMAKRRSQSGQLPLNSKKSSK
jgi:hypothetical protein